MNHSEKNLLYAFLLIVVIGGGILLTTHYHKKLNALTIREQMLNDQLQAFNTELDNIEEKESFRKWLQASARPPQNDEDADASLLKRLNDKAIEEAIVSNIALKNQTSFSHNLMKASVSFEVKGPQHQVLEYISTLRDYENLILLQRFVIRRSEDGETLDATIELAKIYLPEPNS